MRLDVFLAKARILKTRSLVKTAIDEGMVFLNGLKAKPASMVKIGHIVEIDIPRFYLKLRVVTLPSKNLKKSEAHSLYEVIESRQKEIF